MKITPTVVLGRLFAAAALPLLFAVGKPAAAYAQSPKDSIPILEITAPGNGTINVLPGEKIWLRFVLRLGDVSSSKEPVSQEYRFVCPDGGYARAIIFCRNGRSLSCFYPDIARSTQKFSSGGFSLAATRRASNIVVDATVDSACPAQIKCVARSNVPSKGPAATVANTDQPAGRRAGGWR